MVSVSEAWAESRPRRSATEERGRRARDVREGTRTRNDGDPYSDLQSPCGSVGELLRRAYHACRAPLGDVAHSCTPFVMKCLAVSQVSCDPPVFATTRS